MKKKKFSLFNFDCVTTILGDNSLEILKKISNAFFDHPIIYTLIYFEKKIFWFKKILSTNKKHSLGLSQKISFSSKNFFLMKRNLFCSKQCCFIPTKFFPKFKMIFGLMKKKNVSKKHSLHFKRNIFLSLERRFLSSINLLSNFSTSTIFSLHSKPHNDSRLLIDNYRGSIMWKFWAYGVIVWWVGCDRVWWILWGLMGVLWVSFRGHGSWRFIYASFTIRLWCFQVKYAP